MNRENRKEEINNNNKRKYSVITQYWKNQVSGTVCVKHIIKEFQNSKDKKMFKSTKEKDKSHIKGPKSPKQLYFWQ